MNEGIHQPQTLDGVTTPVEVPVPPSPRLVNPTLSGSLTADHEALQNDLVQAQELAADFQRQLAGKSNEYAQLKQILEKTQKDLEHLQEGIVELRAERHRLANEAMRAIAFETKLGKVTGERDRLRIDLEVVRQAMGKKVDEMMSLLRDRDRRIAELVIEMVSLRNAKTEEVRVTTPEMTMPLPFPEAPSVELPAMSEEAPEIEIIRAPPAEKLRR